MIVRLVSIDLLRTIAIFLMVLVHFVENLSGNYGSSGDSSFLSDPIWLPTGFAAPLFTFLVGVSYRLWLTSQKKKGRDEAILGKIIVRRGLFLFGTGFAFNILVWLPDDTFNWDVLTLIGASLLVLNLAHRLPGPILPFLCVVVLIISPVLRALSDYPSYWQLGYFDSDTTLPEVFTGFFTTGFFPFFPWIVFPLAGFLTAGWIFPQANPQNPPASGMRVPVLVGLGLIGFSALTLAVRPHAPALVRQHILQAWTMFPPSLAYVTGTLGIALLALAFCHRQLDGGSNRHFAPGTRSGNIVATLGGHSFSIYLLHHMVHLWPLWIYGAMQGKDPTYYWQNAMPAWASLVLAILFLVFCYPFFRWVDKNRMPSVESWMRWVCD